MYFFLCVFACTFVISKCSRSKLKPLSYLIQSGPDCKQHFHQLVWVPGLHRSQLLMFTNRFARCFSEPGSGHSLWRESDFIKESKLTLRFGVLSNFLTICNIASTCLEILCQAATVSNIVAICLEILCQAAARPPAACTKFYASSCNI